MATAIFLSGISLGQIIVPLLTRVLQEYFGYSGAILIHGAILLNSVVACSLFRPVKTRSETSKLQLKRSIIEHEKLINEQDNQIKENIPKVGYSNKVRKNCCEIISSVVNNLKGLRNTRMLVVCFSMACLIIGFINFISLVPFAMISYGYSSHETSLAVASGGAGNMIMRVLMSFVADRPWLNKKLCFITGTVVASICSAGKCLLCDARFRNNLK